MKPLHSTGSRMFQEPDDPSHYFGLHEWERLADARAYASSPALAGILRELDDDHKGRAVVVEQILWAAGSSTESPQ
jgi:hypothetical protein